MSEKKRITKREKFAVNLAISALSYFRSAIVFLSIIAAVEKEWLVLLVSWGVFILTSHWLTKTLDTPSEETLCELNELLALLTKESDG